MLRQNNDLETSTCQFCLVNSKCKSFRRDKNVINYKNAINDGIKAFGAPEENVASDAGARARDDRRELSGNAECPDV